MKKCISLIIILFSWVLFAQKTIEYSFDYEIIYKIQSGSDESLKILLNTKHLDFYAIKDEDGELTIYDIKKNKTYNTVKGNYYEKDGVETLGGLENEKTNLDVISNNNSYTIYLIEKEDSFTIVQKFDLEVDPKGVDFCGLLFKNLQLPALKNIKGEIVSLQFNSISMLQRDKSYEKTMNYIFTEGPNVEVEIGEVLDEVEIPSFESKKATSFAKDYASLVERSLRDLNQEIYSEEDAKLDSIYAVEFQNLDTELSFDDKIKMKDYLKSFPVQYSNISYPEYFHIGPYFENESLQKTWDLYMDLTIDKVINRTSYKSVDDYIPIFESKRIELEKLIQEKFTKISENDQNALKLSLYTLPADWTEIVLEFRRKELEQTPEVEFEF